MRIKKFLFNIKQRYSKWRCKRKNNKLVSFWFVYDSDPAIDSSSHLLTILVDKSQLHEFIVRYYCFSEEHYEHYISWAELRELDYQDYKTMKEFFKVENSRVEVFIKKCKVSLSSIASIIRIQSRCVPLDASFESEREKELFNTIYKLDFDTNPDGWRELLNSLIEESQELLDELDKEKIDEPQA